MQLATFFALAQLANQILITGEEMLHPLNNMGYLAYFFVCICTISSKNLIASLITFLDIYRSHTKKSKQLVNTQKSQVDFLNK